MEQILTYFLNDTWYKQFWLSFLLPRHYEPQNPRRKTVTVTR